MGILYKKNQNKIMYLIYGIIIFKCDMNIFNYMNFVYLKDQLGNLIK